MDSFQVQLSWMHLVLAELLETDKEAKFYIQRVVANKEIDSSKG